MLCWSTYLLFLRRELSLGPGFPLKSIEIFGVINFVNVLHRSFMSHLLKLFFKVYIVHIG